jgi:hypothetical protein
MLGSGYNPAMGVYDYSPYFRRNEQDRAAIADNIKNATNMVMDYAKERKDLNAKVKAGDFMMKYAEMEYPDKKEQFAALRNEMANPNLSKAEQAAMADSITGMIALGTANARYDKESASRERELGMREQQFQQQYGATQMEIERQRSAVSEDLKNKEVIGPVLFDHTLKLLESTSPAAAAEIRKNAAGATAAEKFSLTNSMMGMIPKSERIKAPAVQDIPTGNGGSLKMQWDENAGEWTNLQTSLQNTGGNLAQGALPEPLQPYATAFNTAGAKYGVDPRVLAAISMHETGNGTSNAFRNKNNAMGVSNNSGPVDTGTVEASIDKMAALLAAGQQGKGPYAGKTTIDQIAGTYAPVGAENDPRGLNSSWTTGVSKHLQQLGGNPAATIGYTPPPNTTPSISENIALEKRAEEKTEKSTTAAATVAKSEEMMTALTKLEKHPGFNNLFGSNIGVPTWVPGSAGADAKALFNQVEGKGFIEAIQAMKGMGALSNAEGEKASMSYLGITPSMSEGAAKARLAELKALVAQGIARTKSGSLVNPDGSPMAAPAQPASSDLLNAWQNRPR